MKTDAQLKKDVTAELQWDPSIHADQVGVAVKDGVVSLTGYLETYLEKFTIEKVVARVQGVKAIAVEMDVRLDPGHKRGDTDIASAIESAFAWYSHIPADRIQVKVEKGLVQLTGEVDWEYQRRGAENAVRPVIGVIGVSNKITLKAATTPANVSDRIREAFARHAAREAKGVEVLVGGATVTLRGMVDSFAERVAASTAAWSAPGINKVVNEIRVHA